MADGSHSFEVIGAPQAAGLTPCHTNAIQAHRGDWLTGIDTAPLAGLRTHIERDPRPAWCRETFGDLGEVLELGPADGHHTAALEWQGASVTAIEGHLAAFHRCLVLKNALDLRARFLLGDFLQWPGRCDLLFASGVLYHLQDPVGFLEQAAEQTDRLFLWTHYYDAEVAASIDGEAEFFDQRGPVHRRAGGESLTYHLRSYRPEHMASPDFVGGLRGYGAWLSRDDLFAAVANAGFRVVREVEDSPPGRMPAVNIFAVRA